MCTRRRSGPWPPVAALAGFSVLSIVAVIACNPTLSDTSESSEALDAPGGPTSVPSRSASGQIEVSHPSRGQRVSHSFVLKGRARVYENRVSYRLRKGVNQIIAEGTTVAHAPDVGQFGPFQTTVSWQDDTPGKTAELEVFSVRPKDGAPDHVVSFPVLLD